MKKKLLLTIGLATMSLALANGIYAQCGPDGTQPCGNPKTKSAPAKPAAVFPAAKSTARTSAKTKNTPPPKNKKSDTSIYDSLKVNPPKKSKPDNESVLRSLELPPEIVKKTSAVNDFFPLDGITLGKTTEQQLALLQGEKNIYVDQTTKEEKVFYKFLGNSFWIRNGVADSVALFNFQQMPLKWRQLGFNWEMSFNEAAALLRKLGYEIEVAQGPPADWNGQKDFIGRIKAVKNQDVPLIVAMNVVFTKQKPSVDSKGTVFYFLTMIKP